MKFKVYQDMRSKILAPISIVLFICSYVYFLYIGITVYDPEAEVSYLMDTAIALAIPVGLSVALALMIWLFKRRSYAKYLYRSLVGFCTAGVGVDLFATYLMFWSAGQ